MNRRELITAAALTPLLGACSATPAATSGNATHATRSLPAIGIQLYTVRELMALDSRETLHELARMGYTQVEFAGLHGHNAATMRSWLNEAGLISPSGHANLQQLVADPKLAINDARRLGNHTLVIPWLPEEWRTRDAYPTLKRQLYEWSAMARDEGLQLGYHNHAFEFSDQNGWRLFDALLADFPASELQFEIDLFWITKAGADVAKYLSDHGQRFSLCHVKDMSDSGDMIDVGSGTIEFATLFRQLYDSHPGTLQHFYVEHDKPTAPLQTARVSYAHLRELRY